MDFERARVLDSQHAAASMDLNICIASVLGCCSAQCQQLQLLQAPHTTPQRVSWHAYAKKVLIRGQSTSVKACPLLGKEKPCTPNKNKLNLMAQTPTNCAVGCWLMHHTHCQVYGEDVRHIKHVENVQPVQEACNICEEAGELQGTNHRTHSWQEGGHRQSVCTQQLRKSCIPFHA